MQQETILKMSYPSQVWQARWREAIPLGNGITGAAVYGCVGDETVLITHTDLLWHGRTPPLPNVHDVLPVIRENLLSNKPYQAANLMKDTLHQRGYDPEISRPRPLCDLRIKQSALRGFMQYQRQLNMTTGEAEVQWIDNGIHFVRRCFVSYVDDILVMEINTENHAKFSCVLALEHHDVNDALAQYEPTDRLIPSDSQARADHDNLIYTACNDDGRYFGAVARVITGDGNIYAEKGQLLLHNVSRVLVVLKTFIRAKDCSLITELQETLAKLPECYHELLKRHLHDWLPVFTSASLSLASNNNKSNEVLLLDAYQGCASAELLEKLWTFGRYLLVASSRSGGNPCSLYGLWCGEYSAT